MLPLDKPAGILVKTTCVDYPGTVAAAFFLKGCNLRCPYCYNKSLVLDNSDNNSDTESLNTVEELFSHLEKRKNVLSGLVISGGEPLINPYTPVIIKKAKELGYKVKLDTNGTLPEKLKAVAGSPDLRPDFIAMDIKTAPSRYGKTVCGTDFTSKVKESAEITAMFAPDAREYRTVLVPPLVQKEDIKEMAQILPKDASWQFAQFQNKNCLDSSYNKISPYTDAEAEILVEYAKTFIPGAKLR